MKLPILIATTACVMLGACASSPDLRPTEAIARAENSISQADQAGARRYDPAALDSSKQKLMDAKAANDKGDQTKAIYLAQQAEVEAEMATAKGRTAEANKAAAEVRASTEALRAESSRERTVPTTPTTPTTRSTGE